MWTPAVAAGIEPMREVAMEETDARLRREGVESSSRLSCQIKVSDDLDGLAVRMPEEPALKKT
jgi:ferredoxin